MPLIMNMTYLLIIFIGILVSFLANYCLADVEGGWRVMFGISATAAIAQVFAMMFLPQVHNYSLKSENGYKFRRLSISFTLVITIIL